MVHWIKNQETWADLQLGNEFPSVAKYLFCLSDLKERGRILSISDREGEKGGGWPRECFMTCVNQHLILLFT